MAIIKITEKEKVQQLTDEASLLITQEVDGVESLRRINAETAIDQYTHEKMTRYIIRLVETGGTYSITDIDGHAVNFATLLAAVRDTSNYVVCVCGNSKLRPQYVGASEIVFTGLSRDASGADTLRMIVRASGVQYDVLPMATESDINELDEKKANIDGYYSDMAVGYSENMISPDGVTEESEFVYRTTAGDVSVSDGTASIESIRGNTVVWNQGVELSANEKNVNCTYNSGSKILYRIPSPTFYHTKIYAGHKYYCSMDFSLDTDYAVSLKAFGVGFGSNGYEADIRQTIEEGAYIFTATSAQAERYENPKIAYRVWCPCSAEGTYAKVTINKQTCIDLTKMFGAGNEPSTVDDPRIKWIETALAERPQYDEGSLLSVDINGLKTVGFNQWDGTYTRINSNNVMTTRINVLGNQRYMVELPTSINAIYCNQYDVSGNELIVGNDASQVNYGRVYTTNSAEFIMLPNTAYCEFKLYDTTGKITDTFAKSVCIHLKWSGYRNGEYEEYWENTCGLPISDIKDESGNVLFPNGLCRAGDVYDEITPTKAIKRVGVVDLGTLIWYYDSAYGGLYWAELGHLHGTRNNKVGIACAKYTSVYNVNEYELSDKVIRGYGSVQWNFSRVAIKDSAYATASDFKASLNGVMLYFELAEPIEVPIDINMNYKMSDFGTEEFLSDNVTALVPHTFLYQDNLRDKLRRDVLTKTPQDLNDAEKAQVAENTGTVSVIPQNITREQQAQARDNIGAANANGYSPNASVGLADNLISPDGVIDSEPYVYRTTAGSQSVTDGYAELRSIKGNTVVWNQLTQIVNVTSDEGSIERVGDDEYKVTFNALSSRLISRALDAVGSIKNHNLSKNHIYYFLHMQNLEQQTF